MAGLVEASGLVLAAVVGVVGYLVNNVQERRRLSRLKQLAVCETALDELYGPLRFHLLAGIEAYRVYRSVAVNPPDALWMLWMEHILMPHNARIKELLLRKGYLLSQEPDEELAGMVAQFLRHTHFYESLILEWERGNCGVLWNDSSTRPELDFPAGLDEKIAQLHVRYVNQRNDLILKLRGILG